jgi:putative ABC transport system substrate-binding protein
MIRREFIRLVGGAAIWPTAARAQQAEKPVIGFLRNTDAASSRPLVSAFRRGLEERGYIDGRNVAIEYRWADGHDEKLSNLAGDLVKRRVAVIVAGGGSVVAMAAKHATASIPIIFELGGDPVKMGLVSSLSRPGANLTGVALFSNVIGSKRLELLLDLMPHAKTIGLLVNPDNPNTGPEIKQAQDAASSRGIVLEVLNARSAWARDAYARAYRCGQPTLCRQS